MFIMDSVYNSSICMTRQVSARNVNVKISTDEGWVICLVARSFLELL